MDNQGCMADTEQRTLRQMARLLYEFDGWRCLWRGLAAALAYGGNWLLPVAGAVAAIYIGSDLELYRVVIGAIVSLGSTALAGLVARRKPWLAILARRLWTYEAPNPKGTLEILTRDEDSARAHHVLRRARFAPRYAALMPAGPPDAPGLKNRIGVQEPEAWRQSAFDEDRLWRIATLLGSAGIRARVSSLDAFPDGRIEKWAEMLPQRTEPDDGRTTDASSTPSSTHS